MVRVPGGGNYLLSLTSFVSALPQSIVWRRPREPTIINSCVHNNMMGGCALAWLPDWIKKITGNLQAG